MKRVRIKPYDEKKGHRLQRLTLSPMNGKRFEAGVWYEVEDGLAEELAMVNQDSSISEEQLDGVARAFDIYTPEVAARVAEEELRVASGAPKLGDVMLPPERGEEVARRATSTDGGKKQRAGASAR